MTLCFARSILSLSLPRISLPIRVLKCRLSLESQVVATMKVPPINRIAMRNRIWYLQDIVGKVYVTIHEHEW